MGVNLLMNYNIVKNLILEIKEGNTKSKEKLVEEFKPFIINLSTKTFIDGYNMYDIQNECYAILLKCINKYNPEKHRFVAYATNAIKNGVYTLIRNVKRRSKLEGITTLTHDGNLESLNLVSPLSVEDNLFKSYDLENIELAIKSLTEEEQEFIKFVFIKNKTIKEYALIKNMNYSVAVYKKSLIMKKINNYITQ